MRKTRLFEWQLLMMAFGFVVCQTAPMNDATDPPSVKDPKVVAPYQDEQFSVFDWNIYKLMANKYKGNLLISPLSVKLALVLLYEGAQDEVALKLGDVMHLPRSRWDTRSKFAVVLQSLKPVFDEYKLDIGTRMYLNSGVDLKQSFAANVRSFYRTDVVSTNFSNYDAAAASINNWVSNVTHENVKKMIEDGDSIKDAVMLILNAFYFKGSWHNDPFSPDDTKPGKFHTNPTEQIDVPFMKTEGNFFFTESLELDAKILRLPYVGRKLSMYFVLPKTVDGLDNLIENINPFVLKRHVGLMQELPVEIRIPKFKFDYTSNLVQTLRDMGLNDIFENSAAFNEIARAKRDSPPLVVTNVVQKAGIEVNEKGTAAYALTEVQIGNKMGEQTFNADHPFLFFIEDEITGAILYMGRLSDPTRQTGSTETPSFPDRINAGPPISEEPPKPASAIRDNYFNVELLQAVAAKTDGNQVVSPLSVKAALTALVEGTGGRTRQELLSTLRLPADVSQLREAARRTLAPFVDSKKGTELSLITRLYTAYGIRVSMNYNNALEAYYKGSIQSLNFRDPAMASATINAWIQNVTENNIHSLVEPGSLSPNTMFLLTSVVYFRGRWLHAFDEAATTKGCFNVPDVGCKYVPMMESKAKYNYTSMPSLQSEILELPYEDGRLSMLIFFPYHEGLQNLHILSKDLTHTHMSTILSSLFEAELLITLPRFTIDSKFDLRPALESLGIKDLFDLSANLSGMIPHNSARVDRLLHNAKIEVNELGTVAAAASAIDVIPLMGHTYEPFHIDRPFLFTIVDRPTSSILFAGRVVAP
ncbi:uncharacterized protein [Venturia canescens]|uniref:uncharacterized protein n=1 Tax=Venturia canescens TaxID=32260 RepID=UPI001C9CABAD|nr:uncharacterized protein LOC122415617 [Venturia canescens]